MTEEIRYIANLQRQEEFDNEVTELKDELKRLEQENKELRQQYNCYACDTCQGKEDYRNMKRHCENAIKTVHTYRSTLEEIKVIADDTFKVCDDDCGNARKIKLIIDRINDVL